VPQLTVRNIEEAVVRQLRTLAATHGVSMEEEHRRLLRGVLLGEPGNRKSFSKMLFSIPKAAASVHDLTQVTRIAGDFERAGIRVFKPI
jgi:plasmid stability protein